MSIPIAESGQPDLKGHTKGKGSRESAQAEQTESTSQSDYLEQVSVQQDSHGMLQFMSTTRRRRTFPGKSYSWLVITCLSRIISKMHACMHSV